MKQAEVSMVDEILSTPEGRAMMKCVEERDELRALLDIAHRIVKNSQPLEDRYGFTSNADQVSWDGLVKRFREGYAKDLEKR